MFHLTFSLTGWKKKNKVNRLQKLMFNLIIGIQRDRKDQKIQERKKDESYYYYDCNLSVN